MKIIDSNILIYSAENADLLEIMKEDAAISDMSRLEVLGYHQITDDAKEFFNLLFEQLQSLQISGAVIDKAIELRQQANVKVADCIIAATAILNNATIYTRNVNDFHHWPELTVINPIDN